MVGKKALHILTPIIDWLDRMIDSNDLLLVVFHLLLFEFSCLWVGHGRQ